MSPLMVTFMSIDVLMAMTVKVTVFFGVMLCRLVAGCVSEELCLHLQGTRSL